MALFMQTDNYFMSLKIGLVALVTCLYSSLSLAGSELSIYHGYTYLTEGDLSGETIGWIYQPDQAASPYSFKFATHYTVAANTGSRLILFGSGSKDEDRFDYSSMQQIKLSLSATYTRLIAETPVWLEAGIDYSKSKRMHWTTIVDDPSNNIVFSGPIGTTHSSKIGLNIGVGVKVLNFGSYQVKAIAQVSGIHFVGPGSYLVGLSIGS